jgi:AcrR family transcriptional regulator
LLAWFRKKSYDASNYSLSILVFYSHLAHLNMPKIVRLAEASSLSPRKTPQQSRATATRDAILQSAAIVLRQSGLSGLNTNRVAEVAGISVGSLYQYYPNKASLLSALSIEQHAQLYAKVERASSTLGNASLDKSITKLLSVVLAHQFEQPELAAALDMAERELPMSDEVLAQKKLLIALLVELLSNYRQEIKGDLKTIAMDIQTIVQSLVDAAEMRGEKNTSKLRDRVKRAVLGYLVC